jgi:single-strand DNA-binding protein
MNVLTIAGRLGRDPEAFTYGDNQEGARFSVAVNNPRSDDADWFQVSAFGQSASFALRFLHKGDPVVVTGRVQLDEWEKGGEKRASLALFADRIDGFASKRDEASPPAPRAQQRQAKPQSHEEADPRDWDMTEEDDPFDDQ